MTAQRCPVCWGTGIVPNGFYNKTSGVWNTSSLTPEKCKSCNGTGVVWPPCPQNDNNPHAWERRDDE